jgi:hypothetical protein
MIPLLSLMQESLGCSPDKAMAQSISIPQGFRFQTFLMQDSPILSGV